LKLPRPDAAVAQFGLACLHRFVAIEGTLQATVLGAQTFTSLIPFTVVASAVGPGDSDLADTIVERFGLEGNSARSVHQLFASAGETQSAVTWISIVILVLSALSFTRALQRLFQRAYAPGATVSGLLGALLGVAAGIYVPIAMDWSADKYGLIGIAFALQSFLLVAAFVVVIGAVVGATVVERIGAISVESLREHVR
jgi:uncharacterized BrkB/YihY/UPF0761 family membrane protein